MKEFLNYEILRKIGEGAQGEVYLAKDKRLGRKVAIKSLHVDLITNTVLKERFIGEAKLLGQLSHSSIVTLYDYIVDTSGYHLIMEYLKGNQLDDYINKVSGPINEIRAIDIFLQVLDGIHHIHKLNIVHRDIKPSNIIIDENDKIKLLDFGIAKDYSNDPNLTVVGQSVGGTPMYMSPEHISNAKITVQSDIYSLGVTFWNMLTGKAPYEGLSLAKIYSKIENEELPPIEKIYPFASKKLNDIIKKATAKDPKKRYDSCLSFMRAIEDLKKLLISKTNSKKTKLDINTEKNIDVRVKNVEDASFVVNHIGHIGTEITFSGNPGTKLNIQIHKEGYKSIYKEMVINEDELIEYELKKRMPAFVSLILVSFYFFIETFFKIATFFINKKILKLDESKTNNIYENIDKANDNLNNNIKSVKSGILELSSFFGIILIIILIFTFSIDNSENNNDKDGDTTTVVDDKKEQEEQELEEEEQQVEEREEEEEEEEEKEKVTFEPRGKLKEDWCRSYGNPPYTRVRVYHNGKGGTYNRNTNNSTRCGYKPPVAQNNSGNTNTSSTSSNRNSSSSSSQYQNKKSLNGHYYYTDTKDGINLLIYNRKNLKEWEIEYYKNGTERASFNIKGSISSFYYSKKLNTIVTNRYLGTFDRKHVLNLDLTGNRSVTSGGIETTLGLANDWIKIQHKRN